MHVVTRLPIGAWQRPVRGSGDVHLFLLLDFLQLVETMSLAGLMTESIHMIHTLQSLLEVNSH